MVRTALAVSGTCPDWAACPVWSAPCLKPLDVEAVAAVCKKHWAVIVLEEHSVYGGLGSAVAEIAAAEAPTWVCRIGIPDQFSRFCGSYQYLMGEHRLNCDGVFAQVKAFLAKLSAAHRKRPKAA
jgi:transketolase